MATGGFPEVPASSNNGTVGTVLTVAGGANIAVAVINFGKEC